MNLNDKRTVSELEIENGSTIFLRLNGKMTIFVQTHFGQTKRFIVEPSETVENLRAKIRDRIGKRII